MDSTAGLMVALIFGSIGMGYFIYGKKQQNMSALISGIALCAFPYFISNLWLMIIIGIALSSVPFISRE